MNRAAKWAMWGVILTFFHITIFRIRFFPSIVGYLVWYRGILLLCAMTDQDVGGWKRWMKTTGISMIAVKLLAYVLEFFFSQHTELSEQMAAVLMLAEMACGGCMLCYLSKTQREREKAGSPFWYLIWMAAALAAYEYSLISRDSNWNTAGAVVVLLARILLIKDLAVWNNCDTDENMVS